MDIVEILIVIALGSVIFGLGTLIKADKNVWQRVILWTIILGLSATIYIGWKDYHFMAEQHALMKHEFIEDVVGYNYCDTD